MDRLIKAGTRYKVRPLVGNEWGHLHKHFTISKWHETISTREEREWSRPQARAIVYLPPPWGSNR